MWWIFFLILLIASSDATSSYFFKNFFQRLRPCRTEDLRDLIYNFGQKCGGKYGFFSSHASNSFAILLFLIQCFKVSTTMKMMLVIAVVIISYSRIYLGVHLPLDIIIGGLYGGLMGLAWGKIFKNLYPIINILNKSPN